MIIVEIAGFLGSDAEERFTPTGKKVVSLRVATKVRQGGKDETVWWRVNIWGDRFDKMVPYLRKGTGVIIIGEMAKPEIYDKNGVPQISLTVNAEIIRFSPFGKPERSSETPAITSSHASDSLEGSLSEEMVSYGAGAGVGTGGRSVQEDFSNDDLPF